MATLQELAKDLGLSASTISRVVNNKGFVKESTRELVMEAIKRNNYIPDNAARSLKTGRTRTIGVIIPDVTEIFFTNVLSGVEEELAKYGYKMLLCVSSVDKDKEEAYLSYLTQNHVDGIIMSTISVDSAKLKETLESFNRIVCIDNLPNTILTYDSVISDNIYAGETITKYLFGLGHRKIAVIAGKQTQTTGVDRLIGIKKAMLQLGQELNENSVRYGDFMEKSGYDAVRDILEKSPDTTAVQIASSKMTYGAVKAILGSGRRIPDDISVVGFDIHDPSGGLQKPGITTMIQKDVEIGKLACQLLLDAIENPDKHVCRKILLQPELVIRDSCREI